MFQIAFGIERRHAAGPGRGDRLPVDVVLHVAAREHAFDARFRAIVGDDVAVRVHLDLSPEQRRVRRVADRDEHAVTRHARRDAGLVVPDHHRRHLARAVVLDVLDLLRASRRSSGSRAPCPA